MTDVNTVYDGEPGIPEIITDIANELKRIVDENDQDKYLEAIVLNYSFIENILKYTIFLKITYNHACDQTRKGKESDENAGKFGDQMKTFCKKIPFFQAQNIALAHGVIDIPLSEKINKIRSDRNDTVHQFWLYSRRKKAMEMRTELDASIDVMIELAMISTDLIKEIGIPEICEIDFFFPSKRKGK